MTMARVGEILLRIGAAFAFLYPPINALMEPDAWIGYFPAFTRGIVPDEVLLHGFGLIEIVIALWILSGWKIFWPALLATVMLLGIVFFNLPQMQIVFRDLSIAAVTLSLALTNLPWRSSLSSHQASV